MNFLMRLKNNILSSPKKKTEPVEKRLYIIDVLSSHRVRYVVECTEGELDNIVSFNNTDDLIEFSQEHLGDNLVSYHPIKNKDQYLKIFDENNDYLKEWDVEQKFRIINRK